MSFGVLFLITVLISTILFTSGCSQREEQVGEQKVEEIKQNVADKTDEVKENIKENVTNQSEILKEDIKQNLTNRTSNIKENISEEAKNRTQNLTENIRENVTKENVVQEIESTIKK
jgi:E3 ubiquitin-protein ligase DOA10